MLIDKGVSPGEVITIKLTSGEELITKLVEESVTYYKVSRPMVLSASQQGIGMMPYLFTVDPDKEIKIFKSGVVIAEATDKAFADGYIQQTTGIKLA
jgi:hypothetical protein